MDTITVNDTEVVVHKDGEVRHVMLRIGSKDYDITEMVYDNIVVQRAIESLDSVETRAI